MFREFFPRNHQIMPKKTHSKTLRAPREKNWISSACPSGSLFWKIPMLGNYKEQKRSFSRFWKPRITGSGRFDYVMTAGLCCNIFWWGTGLCLHMLDREGPREPVDAWSLSMGSHGGEKEESLCPNLPHKPYCLNPSHQWQLERTCSTWKSH